METRLNALPQYVTGIDGLDIQFAHVRSRHAKALPLIASTGIAGGVLQAHGGVSQAARFPVAPEFAGIDGWLNTAAPLTVAGLRGRVVLVDFWTYSCINGRGTVPYLNRWQAEYGSHGLQVVGIHTPEFGFERMRPNVEDSVRMFGIRFPVGQDNAFATWRAWGNRAWHTPSRAQPRAASPSCATTGGTSWAPNWPSN